MIDGNKKRKCQLAFELQNLHVFEKSSNTVLAPVVQTLDRINYYSVDIKY